MDFQVRSRTYRRPTNGQIAGICLLAALALLRPVPGRADYPQVAQLKAFTPETDFMSLAGYLRNLIYRQQGVWISNEEADRVVKQQRAEMAGLPVRSLPAPPLPLPRERGLPPLAPSPPEWRFGVTIDPARCPEPDLERTINAAHELGFRLVRVIVRWPEVEPRPGQFVFDRLDRLVELGSRRKLNFLFVVSQCAPWASSLPADEKEELRIRSLPADLKFWERFVRTTANRYKDRVLEWQVWERPSMKNFRGTYQDYFNLLVCASRAVRQVLPHATVVASDPGGPDLVFLVALSRLPYVDYYDAIGLAPSIDAPEQVARYLHAIRTQVMIPSRAAPKDLLITEWKELEAASISDQFSSREGTLRQQSDQSIRSHVAALAGDIRTMIWSGIRDDRTSIEGGERFSRDLVDQEWRESLMGAAMRKMIKCIPPQARVRRMEHRPSGLQLLVSDSPGYSTITNAIVWSGRSLVLSGSEIPGILPTDYPMVDVPTRNEKPADYVTTDRLLVSGEPLFLSDVTLAADAFPASPNPLPLAGQPGIVRLELSAAQESEGIYHRKYRTWNVAAPALVDEGGVRAAQLVPEGDKLNPFFYCDVDDDFMFFRKDQSDSVEVTVRARSADPGMRAGFNLMYDSLRGHTFSKWQWVEPGSGWHDFAFHLNDALFANTRGFDFVISALGSRRNLLVSCVTVRRATLAISRASESSLN